MQCVEICRAFFLCVPSRTFFLYMYTIICVCMHETLFCLMQALWCSECLCDDENTMKFTTMTRCVWFDANPLRSEHYVVNELHSCALSWEDVGSVTLDSMCPDWVMYDATSALQIMPKPCKCWRWLQSYSSRISESGCGLALISQAQGFLRRCVATSGKCIESYRIRRAAPRD